MIVPSGIRTLELCFLSNWTGNRFQLYVAGTNRALRGWLGALLLPGWLSKWARVKSYQHKLIVWNVTIQDFIAFDKPLKFYFHVDKKVKALFS